MKKLRPKRRNFAFLVELCPAHLDHVNHLERKGQKINDIADRLSIPKLSTQTRTLLTKTLKSQRAAQIVETAARLGDFGNKSDQRRMRAEVRKLQKRDGERLQAGKRTAPGLSEFVHELCPILMHFGVRFASGQNSIMTELLTAIADDILPSVVDPRNELRKLARENQKVKAHLKAAILDAVVLGLSSLSHPPLNNYPYE